MRIDRDDRSSEIVADEMIQEYIAQQDKEPLLKKGSSSKAFGLQDRLSAIIGAGGAWPRPPISLK